MKKFLLLILLISVSVFITSSANAVTMYIGDVDGFGYDLTSATYYGADGNLADRSGINGILDSGDLLPDLNTNGILATGEGDDFDNRSTSESGDTTTGSQWTDVALSTSFSGRPGLADDAYFTFNFAVPTIGDADYEQDHFVNFVYGDYDVTPMYATVEGNTVTLLGNSDGGGLDGYIWRAYAPVSWSDMLDGSVTINIIAPNEPYVTFDYALLDTRPISTDPVPEPATMLLLGSGLLGLAGFRKRFFKK